MSMGKQDFIALADEIRDNNATALQLPKMYTTFSETQLNVLAAFCQKQNSRFMRDRWLGYINGKNGKNGGAVKAS